MSGAKLCSTDASINVPRARRELNLGPGDLLFTSERALVVTHQSLRVAVQLCTTPRWWRSAAARNSVPWQMGQRHNLPALRRGWAEPTVQAEQTEEEDEPTVQADQTEEDEADGPGGAGREG